MSLSSFLLRAGGKDVSTKGKRPVIDKGLDTIFQTSSQIVPLASVSNPRQSLAEDGPSSNTAHSSKEKKRKHLDGASSGKQKKRKSENEERTVLDIDAPEASKSVKKKKSSSKIIPPLNADADDGEDVISHLHNNKYNSKSPTEAADEAGIESADQSDEEGDPSQLVHESLAKSSKSQASNRTKAKYIPTDETRERRNARTVFVGNVPVDVAKSRPLQKQFKRHILSFIPTAKIESMRFRSVAFQSPTAQLPSADDTGEAKGKGRAAPKPPAKDGRLHDRDRAASWRANGGEGEEDAAKQYLTPKEKKRIAFIHHEIHEKIDAVNAYVVFAHPPPSDAPRAANLPPPAPTLDPYEAAKLATQDCDGSVFMERTIRVDHVGKGQADAGDASMTGLSDPKTTVFVGNLDFASKEEDLRVFFEGLVSGERGPPDEVRTDSDSDEDEHGGEKRVKRPRTWVKRVRIVRDKDTQLGKGFAYVQFASRECVDEVIALDQAQLKFAKRKLRVQRCKTVPGAAKIVPKFAKSVPAGRPAPARMSDSTQPVPKGDPKLGEKLAHLPKDARKKAKATDADRVARRLAKKHAKVLAEKGVKARVDRERVRKKPAGPQKADKVKKRVRSGRALTKMNGKK